MSLLICSNTLVPHGENSTRDVENLFQTIHNIGFKTLLLTNNNEKRVKRFNKNINTLYICNAEKPKVANYLKAIEIMKIKKEEILFIGDQIFTDIFGANNSGIDNILVKFIGHDVETKIGIRRNIEKVFLKLYGLNKSCQNRIGDILKKEVIKKC